MTQTFIYNPDMLDDRLITVDKAEARHMISVLRLGRGDLVRLIDGRGATHLCEIVTIGSRTAVCQIIKSMKRSGEPSLELTLAIGLSAGTRIDTVIEKGTEVGVSRFIPLLTEKGKVKLGETSSVNRKMSRWGRVSRAAVKQAGRSIFPQIDRPVGFDDFLAAGNPRQTVLFHPDESSRDLYSFIESVENNGLTIMVGPESGFSSRELKSAADRAIRMVSVGDRILRTETAGIVLSALAIYHYEMVKR